jgi:hypothetical protein
VWLRWSPTGDVVTKHEFYELGVAHVELLGDCQPLVERVGGRAEFETTR